MSNRRQFLGVAAAGAAGVALTGRAQAAAGSHYVLPPEPTPSLPVAGTTKRFPVHRIYCMGLNYPDHVHESSFRAPGPFYFEKSNDMIVESGSTVDYPLLTKAFQYECELVVALKSGGIDIPLDRAQDCIYGYAVGLDMTRRDLQGDALHHGLPWEQGKSFDQSAPCGEIHPVSQIGLINKGHIQLTVNGKVRQSDDLSNQILDVAHVIAFISTTARLAAGDLIYMGTPAGTSSVVTGDEMVGSIDRLGTVDIKVGPPPQA